jgi:hypothetical protein
MPQSLAELWAQISDVNAAVYAKVVQCTGEELDQYCFDICHVTCDMHVECEVFLCMSQCHCCRCFGSLSIAKSNFFNHSKILCILFIYDLYIGTVCSSDCVASIDHK